MITVTAWQPIAAALIKPFEGCKLKAYLCPAGVPTIGWGATGPDVRMGMTWTQQQADDRFMEHLQHFGEGVEKLLGDTPVTAHQMAALVSLAYNIGLGNLGKSTLLKKHKAGDYAGAKAEFTKWNLAGGKILAGLTRRRNAEALVYGKGDE